MSAYVRVGEDTDEPCSECDVEPANLYEDDAGDVIVRCESCADDYPRCPCGERGEIRITGGAPLWVCRRCAAEEEGEEA